MHNVRVETMRKCRRLVFHRVDWSGNPAGKVDGVTSGGGSLLELSGKDLMVATYNRHDAWELWGCLEMYYNDLEATKPGTIDLAKLEICAGCGCDRFIAVCCCEIRAAKGDEGETDRLLDLLLTARDESITARVPTPDE